MGTITLYNNGTLINSGNPPLSNLTSFSINGMYNITTIYSGNENYTSTFETWWVNVSIPPILDVHNLSELYANNTERTFGFFIQNINDSSLSDISWKLDTNETIINSQFNSTLQSNESKYVIVEYNYSASGNYTVTATASSSGFSDSESIQITILIFMLMNFGLFGNKKVRKRIRELTKSKKGIIKLSSIFLIIILIILLASVALSQNQTNETNNLSEITGSAILGQLVNISENMTEELNQSIINQTINETYDQNITNETITLVGNISEEENISIIEGSINITENSTEINQTTEPEENQTNLTQSTEVNITEPIGVNETNVTEPEIEIMMETAQEEGIQSSYTQ